MNRLLWISLLFAGLFILPGCGKRQPKDEIVKVGVLHSETGSLAPSERSVIDATLLAIKEINESDYLPGIEIVPVIKDGQSKEQVFANETEELLRDDDVSAIFGGWTSASRKAMIPVLERFDGLLFYPVQYEGAETSPYVVYTGASPNQQIIPAVYWAMHDLGAKRFFLVGSDYVFPRTANEIIKDQVRALGGEVVGERYLPLGSKDADDIVEEIKDTQPDFILNTINGNSNEAFFQALRTAEIFPQDIPTLSFSLDENLLHKIGSRMLAGDYAAWNYFQSIPTKENREFVKRFKQEYGNESVISDPMESAYSAVYLWAEAIKKAGRDKDFLSAADAAPDVVRETISNRSFKAPGGMVFVDPESHHIYKTARVGRILDSGKPTDEGQFEIEWESESPVRPIPYPIFRPMEAWEEYLELLQQGWNGQWSAPAE
ncbi:MAG: urea ABC transporter substrate-binding protein [Verrucomicrobiota bacterium]